MQSIYLTIALAPLVAAIVAGLFGRTIGRTGAQSITIAGVALSCALSMYVLWKLVVDGMAPYNGTVYTWLVSDGLTMEVGFLIDRLSALMMVVVTFVSLMVHIYTIGYMHDDDGYQRFFSYISLFTFSMLMLVMSNNFMQLFFGWEAVGLVSYLLIGFGRPPCSPISRPFWSIASAISVSCSVSPRFCTSRDRWITPRCSGIPINSRGG